MAPGAQLRLAAGHMNDCTKFRVRRIVIPQRLSIARYTNTPYRLLTALPSRA
jgi:hypothetical protein